MTDLIVTLNNFLWGTPLLILLVGGGIYLAFISKFTNLRYFAYAFKLLFHKKDKSIHHKGDLSHFQALTNALSATVGLGNIAGVAVAITQGGPGAVFWMWVSALLGMNTKFFECTLAMMYRGDNYKGELEGGPMYVMEFAFGKVGKIFAIIFSVSALIGTVGIFQSNQLSQYIQSELNISPYITMSICVSLVLVIIVGGVKRIGKATAIIVPFMCVVYLIVALILLIYQYDKIPALIGSIFIHAFTGKAALGAFSGIAISEILKIGIQRAAFSNEAGMGTAPMAHSNAQATEPVSEGLVAMLGPFIDTVIVCTITALVILLGIEEFPDKVSGIQLTTQAFNNLIPGFGKVLLGLTTFFFSFSTMVGMANYNKKCWDYLFKGKILGDKCFYLFHCGLLFAAGISALEFIINLVDLSYAIMAIPNMITTIFLARHVVRALKSFSLSFEK